MNCQLPPSASSDELCSMEQNGTFNFSLKEVYTIILEHRKEDRNVGPLTEALLIAIYGSLMLVGILANLIVSFVVARRPQMHTARNLYIVNLTVSDMTLCLICMPFTLISILRRQWNLGELLCKLVPALQGTNIMVSIGTITVIALDRYWTIVRGQDAARSRNRVIISIALVWLLSFIATLPVVFFQDGVQRWACTKRGCRAFLKLSPASALIYTCDDHNHAPVEDSKLNRERMSNSLKRKATEDISKQPSKLVHQELHHGDVPTLTLSDVKLIKQNVRRERRKIHPKLPLSRQEAISAIENLSSRTNQGELLLSFADKEKEIIVFATASNLKILTASTKIFVDGTFRSCPKLFQQIFIIHALVNERTIPLAFCLLPNKETSTYKSAFEGIRNKCLELGVIFAPEEVFIDFEVSIHHAALEVWPSTTIRGCRFHLGQSWWKKIQNLGLSKDSIMNGENSQFLKLFFGLPFLSPEEVEEAFIFDIMSVQPDSEKIREFTDYILETYILEDATFPPRIWAVFEATTNRTTNSCEAFHSRLNALVPSPHPNIFILLEAINDIQSEVYVSLRSKKAVKTQKIKEKEEFLREKMVCYKNRQLPRVDYLKHVSFKFLPVHM